MTRTTPHDILIINVVVVVIIGHHHFGWSSFENLLKFVTIKCGEAICIFVVKHVFHLFFFFFKCKWFMLMGAHDCHYCWKFMTATNAPATPCYNVFDNGFFLGMFFCFCQHLRMKTYNLCQRHTVHCTLSVRFCMSLNTKEEECQIHGPVTVNPIKHVLPNFEFSSLFQYIICIELETRQTFVWNFNSDHCVGAHYSSKLSRYFDRS